jgi:hypothetical protein
MIGCLILVQVSQVYKQTQVHTNQHETKENQYTKQSCKSSRQINSNPEWYLSLSRTVEWKEDHALGACVQKPFYTTHSGLNNLGILFQNK